MPLESAKSSLDTGNLIDEQKMIFRRGMYQFESLEDVARKNPDYIMWLFYESKCSENDSNMIGNFIELNPDYFEGE